ncbi:hypothetical protein HOY82DRAFT_542403 [Tuber indicum]|nr:hypothetical protein HOY82DRAFT_542403 [Tuber indicum]
MGGKKKNKVASNPARGFATTSVPSKTKTPAPVPEGPSEKEIDTVVASEPSEKGSGKTGEIPGIPNEEEVEEHRLRALVDKLGQRARKETQRIVTRVEVEKRTIRSICYPLKVNKLLEFDFVRYNNQPRTTDGVKELGVGDQILALAKEEFIQMGRTNETECKRGEALLLNAWILQRAFVSMGFPKGRVEEGLQALADHGSTALDKEKGLDGALEEMFDWLALNCEEEELPGFYDEFSRGKKDVASGSSDVTPSEIKPDSGTPTPQQPFGADKRHLTGKLLRVADRSLESRDVSGEDKKVGRNESDDSADEDVEVAPEELVPQYIKLQTQKYHLHPASTIITGKKVKGKNEIKASSIAGVSPAKAEQLGKIQNKLDELTRDPLFDLREAEDVWRVERLRLEKEEWARKQSRGGSTFKQGTKASDGYTVNSEGNGVKEETESASPIDLPHAEEDSDMNQYFVGGLFEPAPTEELTAVQEGENENVDIRDFELVSASGGNFGKGKPRGKAGVGTPAVKKVLEELCRSRDVNSKIRFEMIPGTSISARSKLIITWSSIAESSSVDVSPITPTLGPGARPPVIISTLGLLCTTFSMASIAAMSKDQADGFIATYALFKLCGKKDEKMYLRLPSIWRELWFELLSEGQLESERQEREVLRNLEGALKIGSFGLSGRDYLAEKKARAIKAVGPKEQGATGGRVESGNMTSDAIKEDWFYRTNRSGYQHMLEHRRKLPMWAFKEDVLAAMENNQSMNSPRENPAAYTVQRISAISLARRVSEELGERKSEVGSKSSLVGYAIRLEGRMHSGTRLIYATTACFFSFLLSPELEEVTHLVLDEVHERSIDSDFLLLVLKKLLVQRKDLRVVLMSATVDADRLSAYLGDAPVMVVPGRTFPVETYYLEDAIRLTQFTVEDDARGSRNQSVWEDNDEEAEVKGITALVGDLQDYPPEIKDTLSRLNLHHINYELIVRLIDFVGSSPEYVDYSKAILIFMPGFAEIRRLNDMLIAHPTFGNNRGDGGWLIYPLHSTIASEDQEAAFSIPPSGMRKIVIATNIAETGITIPDVTCVIDTGKHKEMRFDEKRQLSRLVETFMVEQQTPEIMRLSLQDLVLRIKICRLGQVEEVLSQALDAPLPKNIRRAIDSLLEVGTMIPGMAEELTALGRQLAKLPLDVYLGKLVLMGSIYGCLDAALTIAAILSSKSPFVTPIGHKKEAESCRLSFKRADSDLLTGWNAYSSWRRVCQRKTMMSESEFCQRNYLSSRNLLGIEELKQQLLVSVVEARFLTLKEEEKAELNRCRFSTYYRRNFFIVPESVNYSSENDSIVNSVIAASFYPKLLAKGGNGWRNILNSHRIAIHPSSVNRSYDAHETSHVDGTAIALLCGDVDYKMHAGSMTLDGHRVRFAFEDWKSLIAFKILRSRLKEITTRSFRAPGKELTQNQRKWMQIFYRVFLRLKQIEDEREGGEADSKWGVI